MAKTAAELMAELSKNKEYQTMQAEKKKQTIALETRIKQDELELVTEVNRCGFSITSVWDFVNSTNDYMEAVPVLVRHLKLGHHPKTIAGIARSLAVEGLSDNDELWSILTDLYTNTKSDSFIDEPENRGAQQAIAVALEELANDSRVTELDSIIQNNPDADGIEWLREKLDKLSK